jgi:hypothetical protein
MFSQKIHSSGWAIWLGWVLLSTSGWFVVTVLSMLLPTNLDEIFSVAAYNIIWALFLLVLGAVIAATQWLVLRQFFTGAVRWVVAGSLGMMVGQMVAFPLKLRDLYVGTSGFQLDEISYGAVLGGFLGFTQWLVMRTWVRRAGWWVLGSTIGWTLGMTVGEFLPLNWNSSSASIIYGTITTAIPIALTGVVLVLLLKTGLHIEPRLGISTG